MKRTLSIILKVSLAVIALLLTLGNNCITSGNVMILFDIDPIAAQTDTDFHATYVDLTTNSDWQDHKDQLNSVDDLGFACKITNNEASEATGQIWISEKNYGDPDSVRTHATKILDGIKVPANGTRSLTWQESYDYLSNFTEAKTIVYTEKFYLYFMVAETPFSIKVENIVLFLSVNGKP